jgi:hypothetical protein
MNSSFRAAAAAWLAVAMLGCGGGGDSSGDQPPPAPAPLSRSVSGEFRSADAEGYTRSVVANRRVELVELNRAGDVGHVLASTQTDASGKFRFELPADRLYGAGIAVVGSDTRLGQVRALALGPTVPLSAASETFVQEFFASMIGGDKTLQESAERLASFQHNTALMLELTSIAATDASQRAAGLHQWLRDDEAARAAFDALRSTGNLPLTLGDIGGFLGAVPGAWELDDSETGLRRVTMTRSPELTNRLTATESPVSDLRAQTIAGLVLENDGVTLLTGPGDDPVSDALNLIIGPYRTASFMLDRPGAQELTAVDTGSGIYDFDGDQREDQVRFRLEQIRSGVESVDVYGTRLPALRIDFRSELSITLSAGGELASTEERSQWSVPFAGPVKVDSKVSVISGASAGKVFEKQRVARRGVTSNVSWPGRIKISASASSVPPGYESAALTNVSDGLGALFLGSSGPGDLLLLDTGSGQPIAKRTIPAGWVASAIYVSPDRSKIYSVQNLPPPDGEGVWTYSAPIDTAASQGAIITRYDADTLNEEARIILPPRPSSLHPGQGFPRRFVRNILISPSDPTAFAAQGFDVILVRDTSVAPEALEAPALEQPEDARRSRVGGESIRLTGWDAVSDELWVSVDGVGTLGRIAPITESGLSYSRLRSGIPLLQELGIGLSSDDKYDWITGDRAFVLDYRIVISKTTGQLISDRNQSPDERLIYANCTRRIEQIFCISDDTLIELSTDDLSVLRTWPMSYDLRRASGGILPSGGAPFAPSDGSFVFSAVNLNEGNGSTELQPHLFRISF